MQIHVSRDGQTFGPYSVEQVRQYMESGNLSASDLACEQGGTGWTPLGEMPGIFPAAPSPIPDWIPQRRSDLPAQAMTGTVKNSFTGTRPHIEPPVVTDPLPASNPEDPTQKKKKVISPIEARRRRQKETGKQLMAFGALVFLFGAGTTMLTLFAAAGAGGGVFIIFVGLLGAGASLFVAGYKQFTNT